MIDDNFFKNTGTCSDTFDHKDIYIYISFMLNFECEQEHNLKIVAKLQEHFFP